MNLHSIYRAITEPSWGWRRVLERSLSNESALRWRGFEDVRTYQQRLAASAGTDDKPVFVFPLPSVAWGYLFQRPQQMARALARLGWTVYYAADVESHAWPDRSVRGLLEIEPNLHLYCDGREGAMISALSRPAIVWCYWPHHAKFLNHAPAGSRIIYDCLDDLDVFLQYEGIHRDHASLLNRADLVLASGTKLYEAVRAVRPDVHLCPNACNYEDFAHPSPAHIRGLGALRRESRVLLGYYGALAEWLDWDLLRSVVRTRRDWHLLMVGDDWSGIAHKEGMTREPNVTIWPKMAYEKLGFLLSQFDVAIVPFRVNGITQAVSPIKLFEYMAGGKPIVAAPLQECRKYPPVRLASTAAEFIEQTQWCLTEGRAQQHRESLQECAREHTWEARARQVIREVQAERAKGGAHS